MSFYIDGDFGPVDPLVDKMHAKHLAKADLCEKCKVQKATIISPFGPHIAVCNLCNLEIRRDFEDERQKYHSP